MGHSGQVVSFAEPCEYFTVGKAKASTLSLSVLVAIEMFNALNALSEVQTPPPTTTTHISTQITREAPSPRCPGHLQLEAR